MKCTKCVAHKNSENINYYRGVGSPTAEYVFVGECTKEPFTGSSGKFLNNCFKLINLKREDVFITNACRCYTNSRTPSKIILDACFIHLSREIKEIDPKLVIALGASATYALTGIAPDEFKHYRGRLIYSKKIKRKVFIVNHPAAVLYDATKKDIIEKDFLKIPIVLDEVPEETKYYDYTLVDTQKKFEDMFNTLTGQPIIIDMETEGLDPYNENLKIRTLQLGLDEDNIFVLTPDIIYNNIPKLKLLLENNPIIGQDFAFDAKWLYVKLGIFIEHWEHDACLAEFIISGMKDNNLDFTTGKYNKKYYGYWKNIPKGGAHLVQDKKELYRYGASDVGTLYPIHIKQQKMLYKTNQDWLFKNITMPCNKVLTKMSLRGVKVDLDVLRKTDEKYKRRAEKALFIAKILPGIKECESHFTKKFNPRSTDMLRWLLLNYYKLPVLKKTKPSNSFPEGQPKISQKEMEVYAKEHNNEYCKTMENYRSIQTVRKNFLSGSIPKLKNGVAHTTYSLHATTTGRPNSKEPNLLNIARDKNIKRCYIARDNHQFVCGDEAQLEVRIAAVVYKEPKLIEICNDLSKDIHSSITAKAFRKPYDEVYEGYKAGNIDMTELRVRGKGVQFGVIYQQQAESLAYSLGIKVEEAQKFIDDYYENFPNLYDNIERTKKKIIKRGYLYNYFKFKREWKDHTKEDTASLREGVNFLIQSLAFNLIQIAMIKINEEFEKRRMKSVLVLQVYDSIVSESPHQEIDEAVHIMKNIMENVNKPYNSINGVLLSTDIEVGNNLADLQRYEIKN